jgi:hypothetical protein
MSGQHVWLMSTSTPPPQNKDVVTRCVTGREEGHPAWAMGGGAGAMGRRRAGNIRGNASDCAQMEPSWARTTSARRWPSMS